MAPSLYWFIRGCAGDRHPDGKRKVGVPLCGFLSGSNGCACVSQLSVVAILAGMQHAFEDGCWKGDGIEPKSTGSAPI